MKQTFYISAACQAPKKSQKNESSGPDQILFRDSDDRAIFKQFINKQYIKHQVLIESMGKEYLEHTEHLVP